ncbi:MAG: hypothetical protein JSR68_05235 [Proteobacteria bacterium]|nr:hypothetical protein [Pseudomonadota bacterium]
MTKLIIVIILIAITGFVIKNLTDKPLTQHLKNKDNKDQREHERRQAEKERAFWLEKNKIKNKEKRDEFVRQFVVDYIKTSPLVNETQRIYFAEKLIELANDTDNSTIEINLDDIIKNIPNKNP